MSRLGKFTRRALLLDARSMGLKSMAVCLGIAGTLLVLVISRGNQAEEYYFWRQIQALGLGVYALFWVSQCTVDEVRRWTPLLTAAAIAALVGVLFTPPINGMRGWYHFWGFSVQPGELAKPLFLCSLAAFWESRGERLRDWSTFALSLALLALWVVPLLLEPDAGTAAVYTFTFVALYWIQGLRRTQFAVLCGSGAAAFALAAWRNPYMLRRLVGFFHDAEDSAWQAGQMQECLRRGGWFGTFLHREALVRVPYRMNDSLYAVAAEQLGFMGMLPIFLLLLAWMGFCCYWAARRNNRFAQTLILGAGMLPTIQAYLHLAVNLGLFPTTGVTLPFFSYGGSSLVAMMVILACAEVGIKKPASLRNKPD